ncbi:MAG: phage tail spike protein [Clostridia bacterium]
MQYCKAYSRTGGFLGTLDNAKYSYVLKDTPLSTGKVILPVDDGGNALCMAYNLVELFDGDDRVDIFRVIGMPQSSIKATGGTYTYNLEHVLATLMDKVMPGTREIGGTGVTMTDCINYILGFQGRNPRWQLGTCVFTTQFQYSFTDAYLLPALLSLPKQLDEAYRWTTDTTTTPWTLNLVRPTSTVECELRYQHNMTEISKTYDASAQCTRCYPRGYGEGVNQLTIDDVNGGVGYIDADIATMNRWGIIEKPFVDRTIEHADALKRRATQWLNAYKSPRFSYTAKLIDLYRLTGEPFSRFVPGKLCLVIDEEHGIALSVRVEQIAKSDPRGKPHDVTVTLSNQTANVASELADLASRTSINELYAQGATNMFQIPFRDNADKDHPIELDVDIPSECVRINKLWMILHIGYFRSTTRGSEAGGSTETTSSASGGGTVTSNAGGSEQLTKSISVFIDSATTGSPLDTFSANTKTQTDLEADEARTSGSAAGNTDVKADVSTESSGSLTTNGGGEVSTTSNGGGNTESSDNTSHSHGCGDAGSHYHTVTNHRHKNGTGYTEYTQPGCTSAGTHDHSINSATCSHKHYVYDHSHAGGSHSHSINGHSHTVPAHYHTMPSHTHTIPLHRHGMNHFHMCNIAVRIPALSINIPAHTHSVTSGNHSHSVTIQPHTHEDIPGIYEHGTVSAVAVKVDGTAVPASVIVDGQVNLIPYLSKDSGGKITRSNHTITLTPTPTSDNTEGLCFLSGNVSCVVFIRSQGGGNY